MKKISLLFSLFLVIGVLTTKQSYAQLPEGNVIAFETSALLSLGTDFNLESTNYNIVETSSGNYTINATFYLTPGNPFIPEKGTNKVTLLATIVTFPPIFPLIGLPIFSIAEATINKHGKCHVVFHVNGSGD